MCDIFKSLSQKRKNGSIFSLVIRDFTGEKLESTPPGYHFKLNPWALILFFFFLLLLLLFLLLFPFCFPAREHPVSNWEMFVAGFTTSYAFTGKSISLWKLSGNQRHFLTTLSGVRRPLPFVCRTRFPVCALLTPLPTKRKEIRIRQKTFVPNHPF